MILGKINNVCRTFLYNNIGYYFAVFVGNLKRSGHLPESCKISGGNTVIMRCSGFARFIQ